MGRDINAQCRKCRRAGVKLLLKGERCLSPKCAITKRNYPPGIHGSKGKSRLSEYGAQLREKQQLKATYGLLEKQFRNYYFLAFKKKGDTGLELVRLLETRLDNIIFRLGLAKSRRQARQLVAHGLFKVDGRHIDIPSRIMKPGEIIEIKKNKSLEKGVLADNLAKAGSSEIPEWLAFDGQTKKAKIVRLPNDKDLIFNVNLRSIVEFYSR